MLHTPVRSIRSLHTMLIPVSPLFMTPTRTNCKRSRHCISCRTWNTIDPFPSSLIRWKEEHDSWKVIRIRKSQTHKWNPWSLLQVVHVILLRMTRHENVHDYNNPQNVLYEEPVLHTLAFQIDANEIIESHISSDHSYGIFKFHRRLVGGMRTSMLRSEVQSPLL